VNSGGSAASTTTRVRLNNNAPKTADEQIAKENAGATLLVNAARSNSMKSQFGKVAQMNAGVGKMKELAAKNNSMVKAELSPDFARAVQPTLDLLEEMRKVADSTPLLDPGTFAKSMKVEVAVIAEMATHWTPDEISAAKIDGVTADFETKLADLKRDLDAQRAADKKKAKAKRAADKKKAKAKRAADKKQAEAALKRVKAEFAPVRHELGVLSRLMRSRLGVQVLMRRFALHISEELTIFPQLDSLGELKKYFKTVEALNIVGVNEDLREFISELTAVCMTEFNNLSEGLHGLEIDTASAIHEIELRLSVQHLPTFRKYIEIIAPTIPATISASEGRAVNQSRRNAQKAKAQTEVARDSERNATHAGSKRRSVSAAPPAKIANVRQK
jgi:hypothetical protein